MIRRVRPSLAYLFVGCAVVFGACAWLLQSDPLLACKSRKLQLETQAEEQSACVRDSDCALLTRGCGAMATCGLPVRADALAALEAGTSAFEQECEAFGVMRCVSCVAVQARCSEGRCAVAEVVEPATDAAADADQ